MDALFEQKFSCVGQECQTQLMRKLSSAGYVQVDYPGTDYEKVVPTEHVKSVVHDWVIEYTMIGGVDPEKLGGNLMDIVSDIMFQGQNKLPEWANFSGALKLDDFEYVCGHPCLWSSEKRLLFIDYVYSLFTSPDENVRADLYKAMTRMEIFDCWRGVLDDPHEAPLRSVLDKFGTVLVTTSDMSLEEKRWAEVGEMIFFLKNCVDHLTSVEIGAMNQRYYSHIDFMSDDPLYKDIGFFIHMTTYFLYPKLWIELYSALRIAGYKF